MTVTFAGIFFLLATATSKEEDFDLRELRAEVEIIDSNLILANRDTLSFTNADLLLEKPTGEVVNGIDQSISYKITGYNLAAGQTDTLPLFSFKDANDNTYPVDTFPIFFRLQTFGTENEGLFFRRF